MAAAPPPTNPFYHGSATSALPATDNSGETQIVVAPNATHQYGDVLSPASTNHYAPQPPPPAASDALVPVSQSTSNEENPLALVAVANTTEPAIVVPPTIDPFSGGPLVVAKSDGATAAAAVAPPPPTAAAVSAQSEGEEQLAIVPQQQHEHQLVSYQPYEEKPQSDFFARNEELRKLKEKRKVRQAAAAGTGAIVGGVLLGPLGAAVVGASAHQITKHAGRAAEKRARKRYEGQEKLEDLEEDLVLS